MVRACIGSRLCFFPHESRLLVRAPSLRGLYIYLVVSLILVTSLLDMRTRRPHRFQHHTLARRGRWDGKLVRRSSRVHLLVSLHVVQCSVWARSTSRSMDPMSSVPELLFDHRRRLLGLSYSAILGSDSLRLGSPCGLHRAPCPVFGCTTIVIGFACGLPAGAMVALLVPMRPPTLPRAMRSLASPNLTHF